MGRRNASKERNKVAASKLFREADTALGLRRKHPEHTRSSESDNPQDRDALASVWASIKARPFESEAQLYADVRAFFWKHIDVADERYYYVLASATLLSYRCEDFETTPYLFALGPPNSGKSRLLECLQALCPRPILTSSISPAALYQVMHTWDPTLLIDETELYRTDSESGTEIRAILNSGYRRGQYVIRGSKDGKKPKMYVVFGFKALAGTDPLYETTMQRCILMHMEKARRDLPLAIDKQEAMRIREQLEYYRFHHDGGELDPEETRNEIGDARVAELFLPLMTVTPAAEARERLLSLAKDIVQDRLAEEQSGVEAEILKAILACEDKVENGKLSTRDITEAYNHDLLDKEHVRSDWIGRKLQRLGFKRTRFGHGGARAIIWNQPHIHRLTRRYLPDLTPDASAAVPVVPTHVDDTLRLNQGTTADTLQAYMNEERSGAPQDPQNKSANTLGQETLSGEERNRILWKLRAIGGPFSEDYVRSVATKITGDRFRAEEFLKHFRADGLLARDPEGYWRLTK